MMSLLVAVALADPYTQAASLVPERQAITFHEALSQVQAPATPLSIAQPYVDSVPTLPRQFRLAVAAVENGSPVVANPEAIAAWRRLAEWTHWAARVRLSQGKRPAATDLLIDLLAMRGHLDQAEPAVAREIQTQALRVIGTYTAAFSLADLERLREAATKCLSWVHRKDQQAELMLSRLALRVEIYRYRYFILPKSLDDAAPAAEQIDPRNERRFRYATTRTSYRLWAPASGAWPLLELPRIRVGNPKQG